MKLKLLFVVLLLGHTVGSASAAALKFVDVSKGIKSPGTNELLAVTHDGKATLVVVGQSGSFFRGLFVTNQLFTNSAPWTATNSSAKKRLAAVASSGSLFVASGDNNEVFDSPDGVMWTSKNKIFGNTAVTRGLAFDGVNFAAVETAPVMGYTGPPPPSANTWGEAKLVDPSYAESFRAVSRIQNGFAACGFFGLVRRSVDHGLEWRLAKEGTVGGPDLFGIAWNGASTLVSVGKQFNIPEGIIMVSINNGDLGTWTNEIITINGQSFGELDAVTHTGSEFLAVGRGGLVLTSTNGINWTNYSTSEVGTTTNLNGVTFSTTGALKGVGALVGAGGTVILVGTNPPIPSLLMNETPTCAGGTNPIVVSIEGSAGPGLVAVNWFVSNTVTAITSGSTNNGWTFVLTTNGSDFTITPLLINSNLLALNATANIHLQAEAQDLRTGFTSPRTNISRVVYPRPTAKLESFNTTECNANITNILTVKLTGLGPWILRWNDGIMETNTGTVGEVIHTRTVNPTNPFPNQASNNVYFVTNVSAANTCSGNRPGDIQGFVTNTVNPRPTATLWSFNTTNCNGLIAYTLTNTLTGLGPWTVQWNDGLVQTQLTAGPGPVFLTRTVNPTNRSQNQFSNNIYFVTGVTTTNTCAGQPDDIRGFVTNTVNPRPTAVVSGTTSICNGSSTEIQALLSGLGPWTVVWASNNVAVLTNRVTNTVFSTGPFVHSIIVMPSNPNLGAPLNHAYRVRSLSDANCVSNPEDLSPPAIVTVNPRPTSLLTSLDRTNCNDGSSYTIRAALTGLGPWVLTWWDGAVSNVFASPAVRTVFPTNTLPSASVSFSYFVASLTDSNTGCSANVPGDLRGTNVVTVNPRPAVVLTGDTNIYLKFKPPGTSSNIIVTVQAVLTGNGPTWTAAWSDGFTTNVRTYATSTVTNLFTNTVFKAPFSTNFYYSVVSLTNGGTLCPAQSNDLASTVVARVNPLPTAEVTGTNTLCELGSAQIRADLSGLAPWPKLVWSDGVLETNITRSPHFRTVNVTNLSSSVATNFYFFITNLTDSFTNTADTNIDLTGVAQITVYPRPSGVPVISSNIVNCLGVPIQLTAAVAAGFTADWYDSTGTNLLLMGSTNYPAGSQMLLLTNGPVTNLYFVATRFDATNANCQSTNKAPVVLVWQGCLSFSFSSISNLVLQWYGTQALQFATTLGPPGDWTNRAAGTGGGVVNYSTNLIVEPPSNGFFRLSPTN